MSPSSPSPTARRYSTCCSTRRTPRRSRPQPIIPLPRPFGSDVSFLPSANFDKLITSATYRAEIPRQHAIDRFEPAPEPAHERVDAADGDVPVGAPDLGQQRFPAEHDAWIRNE